MKTRLVPGAVLALIGSLCAGQVCDLAFTACPSQLPKGPIAVPMDVIALDARIPYCQESGKINAPTTPSIMFVIDNSGSMRQTDPQHARYTVVNTLLDSIHAANPATRVGVAIFAGRLSFDYRDNAYFHTMFPGDNTQHDSFIPLTPLDSVFRDGRRAVDTIKALLKTDADGNLVYQTTRAKERSPTGGGGGGGGNGGTDITLGFQAALEAMKSSSSPKEAQFIIFLSDGEPRVSDDIRVPLADLYEAGTNTPTTFTVFFDPNSTTPPPTLSTMTDNIRANGYSSANPNSAIWTINLPASELQSLLQKSVLSKILTVPTSGKSVTVSIQGGATQTTAVKADSAHFLVDKRMPINAGTTQVDFTYAHSFLDTTAHPPVPRDTNFSYTLTLQRSAGAALPPYVTASCREQPTLGLYADGKALTEVTADQSRLEARLTPAAGSACAGCTVAVTPSGSADKETVALTAQGGVFSGPFQREENATAVPGDGKLQHLGTDSLVLVWVDPENPLDVVRSAFPYRPVLPALSLYAGGKPIDTVTAANASLEIHLTLPSGEACNACPVQVSLVKGSDHETVTMTGSASPYRGSFAREVSLAPVPGDGKLEHPVEDSIVLSYQDPLNPAQKVRRAYMYIDFQNILGIQPHNSVARTPASQVSPDGKQWIISEAPGLVVQPASGGGSCCRTLSTPADSRSPDSARMVGIIIEASREFTLNIKVYSTLGDFVNSVDFKVPRSEFLKLTPVPGKEARYLRLLWNGLAKDGARAGTGAYIIHTSITLMPLPGLVQTGSTTNSVRRVGILRTPG